MTARRGACPGLADPMPTGDGLLARLAVTRPLGFDEFAALCTAAQAYGNGIIEITSRGSVQLRGLTATSAPAFAAAIEALHIVDPTGGRVIANPLAGLDTHELLDASGLADRLRNGLIETRLAATLAPKVSVVIDGGGALSLGAIPADVRLHAAATQNGIHFQVSIAGDGNSATPVGIVTPECAIETVVDLLKTVAAHGPAARVRDIGARSLHPARFARNPAPSRKDKGASFSAEPIGTHTLHDGSVALGFGFPFGHSDARTLQALIEEARRAGAASVRPAPGRVLLVIGLAPTHASHVAAAAQGLGYIVAADDPRRRVVACAGAPVCAAAQIPARALAPAIVAAMARHDRRTIHISGCAKGCAHPGPAALTVVGIAGKCGIVHEGRAQDAPRQLLDVDQLPAYVRHSALQEADHG
jgi:precorrin-3B synthase